MKNYINFLTLKSISNIIFTKAQFNKTDSCKKYKKIKEKTLTEVNDDKFFKEININFFTPKRLAIQTTLPPESRSHEVRIMEITDIIVSLAKFQIAFVILFGPFARGDWIKNHYSANSINYNLASDYNILIVTKSKKWSVKERATKLEQKIIAEFKKKITENYC
jgi:predicted nucleotidyltransferase